MKTIEVDISKIYGAPGIREEMDDMRKKAMAANELLHNGKGAGSGFLGWVGLPSSVTEAQLTAINEAAHGLCEKAEVIISIGIGGSYLGGRAVIEALGSGFPQLKNDGPVMLFAGQNLSEDYIWELLDAVRDRSLAVIVISKSGTTTESAIAFRILRSELIKRYGQKEAAGRIVAVCGSDGALGKLANKEGYRTFAIPDDIGGRYSVLSPAGLVPIACAGIDIAGLLRGARDMERATAAGVPFEANPAAIYAVARNALYNRGFSVEVLASYEPRLEYVDEWWKQLFGESEGKEGKGLFPASATFTTDLHSMGQYIQDGRRILFETVLSVAASGHTVMIEPEPGDPDGLNYLAGKRVGDVNHKAELGVAMAHIAGGVPNIRIVIPEIAPYYIGALLYFFEKACGISGYMLGVDPFDQPGVEAYKRNMFALLDKPGYKIENA